MFDSVVSYLHDNAWAATIVAGLIGFFATAWVIQTQRAINRRSATFELLSRVIWDKDYLDASGAFYHIMKDQRLLMKYYDEFMECRVLKNQGKWEDLTEHDKKKFEPAISVITKVRSVLNDRELMAIGIREHSIDETIYRRWWYSTYVKEWKEASAFVARLRSDPNAPGVNAYSEMEALARRWDAEGPWATRDRHYRFFGRSITITRSR